MLPKDWTMLFLAHTKIFRGWGTSAATSPIRSLKVTMEDAVERMGNQDNCLTIETFTKRNLGNWTAYYAPLYVYRCHL